MYWGSVEIAWEFKRSFSLKHVHVPCSSHYSIILVNTTSPLPVRCQNSALQEHTPYQYQFSPPLPPSKASFSVSAPIAIASREMGITRRCTEPIDAHWSHGQERSLGFSRGTKTRGAIAIPIQTPTTEPTMTESHSSIVVVVPWGPSPHHDCFLFSLLFPPQMASKKSNKPIESLPSKGSDSRKKSKTQVSLAHTFGNNAFLLASLRKTHIGKRILLCAKDIYNGPW